MSDHSLAHLLRIQAEAQDLAGRRNPPLNARRHASFVHTLWARAKQSLLRVGPLARQRVSARRLAAFTINLAAEVERQVDLDRQRWEQSRDRSPDGAMAFEHEHAVQVRMATLDWIANRILSGPQVMSLDTARGLGWGWWNFEESADFIHFLSQRCEGRPAGRAALHPAGSATQSRPCWIGNPYGAPTVQALMNHQGTGRGRGRWSQIFIEGDLYEVLARNVSGSKLLHLRSQSPEALVSPEGQLQKSAVDILESITQLEQPGLWPAYVVRCGQGPRLLLHLGTVRQWGRADSESAGAAKPWWQPLSLLDPLHMVALRHRMNFRCEAGREWGSYETLGWLLSPVAATARRHQDLFKPRAVAATSSLS